MFYWASYNIGMLYFLKWVIDKWKPTTVVFISSYMPSVCHKKIPDEAMAPVGARSPMGHQGPCTLSAFLSPLPAQMSAQE